MSGSYYFFVFRWKIASRASFFSLAVVVSTVSGITTSRPESVAVTAAFCCRWTVDVPAALYANPIERSSIAKNWKTANCASRTGPVGIGASAAAIKEIRENSLQRRIHAGYGQGSPGEIRTLVGGSKARYAWPLHHRASANLSALHFNLLSSSSLSFPRSNKRSHMLVSNVSACS